MHWLLSSQWFYCYRLCHVVCHELAAILPNDCIVMYRLCHVVCHALALLTAIFPMILLLQALSCGLSCIGCYPPQWLYCYAQALSCGLSCIDSYPLQSLYCYVLYRLCYVVCHALAAILPNVHATFQLVPSPTGKWYITFIEFIFICLYLFTVLYILYIYYYVPVQSLKPTYFLKRALGWVWKLYLSYKHNFPISTFDPHFHFENRLFKDSLKASFNKGFLQTLQIVSFQYVDV